MLRPTLRDITDTIMDQVEATAPIQGKIYRAIVTHIRTHNEYPDSRIIAEATGLRSVNGGIKGLEYHKYLLAVPPHTPLPTDYLDRIPAICLDKRKFRDPNLPIRIFNARQQLAIYHRSKLGKSDIDAMFKAQGGICWWCGEKLKEHGYHIDHRIPLALNGTNDLGNLCISCPKCNRLKRNRLPSDFCGRLL